MFGLDPEERPEWYTGVKRRFSPQKCRQASMMAYTVPSMNVEEEGKFRHHLALHFYVTATSFQRIEDDHLIAALKVLNFFLCFFFFGPF
jgi:hypothetical protein